MNQLGPPLAVIALGAAPVNNPPAPAPTSETIFASEDILPNITSCLAVSDMAALSCTSKSLMASLKDSVHLYKIAKSARNFRINYHGGLPLSYNISIMHPRELIHKLITPDMINAFLAWGILILDEGADDASGCSNEVVVEGFSNSNIGQLMIGGCNLPLFIVDNSNKKRVAKRKRKDDHTKDGKKVKLEVKLDVGVLGNDSTESKSSTSVQEELNSTGAAADDSSGIVPADNCDENGKGLKSDRVRDELKSGNDVAATAADKSPSAVGEDLSAGVKEREAVSRGVAAAAALDSSLGGGKSAMCIGVTEDAKQMIEGDLYNIATSIIPLEGETASPEQQAIVPVSSTTTTINTTAANEPRRSKRLAALTPTQETSNDDKEVDEFTNEDQLKVQTKKRKKKRRISAQSLRNMEANIMRWNKNYAYQFGTVGRDFFKLIGMVIQGNPVPGLHESVSIEWTSFFDGLDYIVMSNPLKVVEFLGVVAPAGHTLLCWFLNTLQSWGCIFSPLSKAYYNALSNNFVEEHHSTVGTQWVFRVCTGIVNDLGRSILTELNFRSLQEVTIGKIRAPRAKQCPARRRQLPDIVFLINGVSYPSVKQARGQLTGNAPVKSGFLADLKTKLCNRFYRNWNSFITNNPNASILSVSDTYPATTKAEKTEVIVKFNRGFTQDDFRR